MYFILVFTFLFLLKSSLVTTDSELSLDKLQKGKCADGVSWSLIDSRSTSVADTNSSIALRSLSFSCTSLLVDFTTGGTLDVTVYIQAASDNSRIEILISENGESIQKHVYGKSSDDYAQGWHTISLTHVHQNTAVLTFIGFCEQDDIVFIKSLVYKEGATLDKNRISRIKRQIEDYDDSEKQNNILESEEDSEGIKIISLKDIKSKVNDDKTTRVHNEPRVNKNYTGQPMHVNSKDILPLNILREARVNSNENNKKINMKFNNETVDITDDRKKENNRGPYDVSIRMYEIEDAEENDDGVSETQVENNAAKSGTGEDPDNSENTTGEENNGGNETEGAGNNEEDETGEDQDSGEHNTGEEGDSGGNGIGGDGDNGEIEEGDNETEGKDGDNGETVTEEGGNNAGNETGEGDENNGETETEEDGNNENNGETETGEDGNNGENEIEGDGEPESNTTESPDPAPVSEDPPSFWNIWTITLISIGSVTVVGIVIITAYYLGKMKGKQGTSSSAPLEIDDIEAPRRIIPRVKNLQPPYEQFGSKYGNSTLDIRD